jgi:dihydroorotate dehydrogenase (NAD+) catalytic subunit
MTTGRRSRWRRGAELRAVDLATTVGTTALPNPVLTAAGTAGHGTELAAYLDLSSLGAVVVKSIAPYPWAGNPAPRLAPTAVGMLNSVGLQGPGLPAWIAEDLPALEQLGARVVCSVWGRSVADYAEAAEMLAPHAARLAAVEVNLSCPNLDGGRHLFAQDPVATGEVLRAMSGCGAPLWAKLTALVTDIVAVAAAAQEAGAAAVVCVNTLLGLQLDLRTRRPALGAGGGGYSGPAIHPVAVRAVWDVHAALPELAIVGAGGVSTAEDAVELLLAGASAVEVGTATFLDPRAPRRILEDLGGWCATNGVRTLAELVGGAHPDETTRRPL